MDPVKYLGYCQDCTLLDWDVCWSHFLAWVSQPQEPLLSVELLWLCFTIFFLASYLQFLIFLSLSHSDTCWFWSMSVTYVWKRQFSATVSSKADSLFLNETSYSKVKFHFRKLLTNKPLLMGNVFEIWNYMNCFIYTVKCAVI